MTDWFEVDGVWSGAYGIRVLKTGFVIAQERIKYEDVAGRSGSLEIIEGEAVYDDIVIAVDCWMEDPSRVSAMAGWLRGLHRIKFGNRPEGCYIGRLSQKIDLAKVVAARPDRTFTLTWRLRPWLYLDVSPLITLTASGSTIHNLGTEQSEPRIAVYGSGDVGLSIGGQQMVLTDLEDGIILDTELQDALNLAGTALMNDHAAGDFMTIPPGDTMVSWSAFGDNDNPGTVTRVEILPRWRCR